MSSALRALAAVLVLAASSAAGVELLREAREARQADVDAKIRSRDIAALRDADLHLLRRRWSELADALDEACRRDQWERRVQAEALTERLAVEAPEMLLYDHGRPSFAAVEFRAFLLAGRVDRALVCPLPREAALGTRSRYVDGPWSSWFADGGRGGSGDLYWNERRGLAVDNNETAMLAPLGDAPLESVSASLPRAPGLSWARRDPGAKAGSTYLFWIEEPDLELLVALRITEITPEGHARIRWRPVASRRVPGRGGRWG